MSGPPAAKPTTPNAQRCLIERFRAARRTDELAVLEGLHAVKHGIRFGAELTALATSDPAGLAAWLQKLAPDLAAILEADEATLGEPRASPILVSPETFSLLAPHSGALPLAAIARRPRQSVCAALAKADGVAPVVLLDRPRHLGNVGAVVRVAAAAGADAVVTTGSSDPWHPAAIRGAAGLQFALPVGRISGVDDVVRPVIAVEPGAGNLTAEDIPRGAILAFGSERRGLSDAVRRRAVGRFALPMREGVSSLNLATAVAATLYRLSAS